jgi:Bacterial RNA polymerase, alpha chain C terminal domain
MNPDELAAAGRVLYGEQWQTSLGIDLNVGDRAMRRWLAGQMLIPDGVKHEISQALTKRFKRIGELIGYVINPSDQSVLHCPTNSLFTYDHEDGSLTCVHRGVLDDDQVGTITEGAKEVVRQELEREKQTAERFVRSSAWWLTHSSRQAVRAPRHADRLFYFPDHGWALDFGANAFLVGKAIERCEIVLDECRDEAAAGQAVSRSDVEARLKQQISGAVANSNGEEYGGYYPIRNGRLNFGAQAISVDDGARFMIKKSDLQWDGDVLATPKSADPVEPETRELKAPEFNPAFLRKVDEFELSVRTANCLKNDDIIYIGELVQKTEAEMLRTPNFGRGSLNEIREILVQMGLHLGMEVPGWPPENIEALSEAFNAA